MRHQTRKSCPLCERLQRHGQVLEAQVRELAEKLAVALKDSSTSSKPPSSDIVKPDKPAGDGADGNRKAGGQPGHPMYLREPFSDEEITHSETHLLDACPDCGGRLHCQATTHRGPAGRRVPNPRSQWRSTAARSIGARIASGPSKRPLPLHIQKGGLVGPHLTALIAYMKGVCHSSFSTVRRFLRDVTGVTISRGQLVKIINKVSMALEQPYDELANFADRGDLECRRNRPQE